MPVRSAIDNTTEVDTALIHLGVVSADGTLRALHSQPRVFLSAEIAVIIYPMNDMATMQHWTPQKAAQQLAQAIALGAALLEMSSLPGLKQVPACS